MRIALAAAALALLSVPALAQPAPRQGGSQGQGRPSAQQPAAQAPAAPPIIACRTANEVCYVAVVVAPNQVAVLYTNAENGEGIEAKPIAVSSGDAGGAGLDMAQHLGRVVLLTGTYDGRGAIGRAELVEVASPLVSVALKAALSGGGGEEEAPPAQQGRPQAPPAGRR